MLWLLSTIWSPYPVKTLVKTLPQPFENDTHIFKTRRKSGVHHKKNCSLYKKNGSRSKKWFRCTWKDIIILNHDLWISWCGLLGQGSPFLYLRREVAGQDWCLSLLGSFRQWNNPARISVFITCTAWSLSSVVVISLFTLLRIALPKFFFSFPIAAYVSLPFPPYIGFPSFYFTEDFWNSECFPEPLLNMSNAIQFYYLVTACSSSQVILFPLLKTFWSFPGNTLLVTVLQIFIVVTSVSGIINTPYGIVYFRVPIRNHSLVPDKVLLTSSPHPFNTFHLRTWAGAFIRAFTIMGLVSLFKLVFSQNWLLLWAHTTGFWNNFKVQHCQLQQK